LEYTDLGKRGQAKLSEGRKREVFGEYLAGQIRCFEAYLLTGESWDNDLELVRK
jgi:hypothetical protein